MSQLILVSTGTVGRYASGFPWYMSQVVSLVLGQPLGDMPVVFHGICLNACPYLLCFIISLMLYLFHLSYQVIETYEVSFDTAVACTPHNIRSRFWVVLLHFTNANT